MDEVDIENQLPEYDNDITEVKAENITREEEQPEQLDSTDGNEQAAEVNEPHLIK